jgi:hypothetical protein
MSKRSPGQVLMFTDTELSQIKGIFAENDEYLYAVRKVLLQFPMTKEERALVQTLTTPDTFALLKKRIHPDIDPDAPLFQLADHYQSLTNELASKGVEEMAPRLKAKQLEIDYLDQQFKALENLEQSNPPVIILDQMKRIDGIDPETAYIGNMARNFIFSWVDSALNFLKTIAGKKQETVEEQKKRLERDSSK